jgi:tRNA-Thr(GGU) m(6)t(6)A37 methyltransferase TsaA
MDIVMRPIGYISSPFKDLADIPRQSILASDVTATIEVLDDYAEGIRDINAGSHIIVLFYFHKSEGFELFQRTWKSNEPRSVFSTRSPRRPNPIGLSVVKVTAVHDGSIDIAGVDMLDGTPVLDIKPYYRDLEP